jgi:hypothetical protein
VEPVSVVGHLGAVDVDDLADLGEVIVAIRLDLRMRETGAGLVPAARVADHRSIVADDEHRLVAQLLEQAQLAQRDGVA